MLAITFADVQSARDRLEGVANRTPVVTSRTLDALSGRRAFLKCESFQRGGAFKFRGAYNKISRLSPDERRRGVVAFSSGNHAQGVALAARLLGVPATIAMPADVPSVKLAATRAYGAEVVLYDRQTEEREGVAERLARERGLVLVPPYDDPAIMAGQGTAALELLETVPDLDTLLVPVSGGGLIAGCATATHALLPGIRVFGVEPEDGNDTWLSLAGGRRVAVPPPATIADGLRVHSPGQLTFPIVQRHVEGILLVSDAQVLEAVRFLLLRMKLVVEPSGAVPVAALLAGGLPEECRRVGLVVSGGNLDPALLAALWAGPVGDLEDAFSTVPTSRPGARA
jgi:threonine dehydratase